MANQPDVKPDIRGIIDGEIKRQQHFADNSVKRADRADARFAVKVLTDLREQIWPQKR